MKKMHSCTYVKSWNDYGKQMDTNVFWADNIFDKRFNAYYPVIISTPHGETIVSVKPVNLYIDMAKPANVNDITHEYEERALDKDDKDIPVVIIKDYFEAMSKNQVSFTKPIKTQVEMINESGKPFFVGVNDYINTMTVNDPTRIYKSFVVIARRVQASSEGLTMLKLNITMSNGDRHEVFMTYTSLKEQKWKSHQQSLWKMTGGLYNLFVDENVTNFDVVNGIRELNKSFPRNFTSIKNAGRKTAKRKSTDFVVEVPKRTLVEFNCFYPMEFNMSPLGYFYVVVAADQSLNLRVANISSIPPLPCEFGSFPGIPEKIFTSMDMYRDTKYGDIAFAAESYARSHGNTILWFVAKDVDCYSKNDTRYAININVVSETDKSIRGTVFVSGVLGKQNFFENSEMNLMVSLDNYAKGFHLNDISVLTPITPPISDFTIFQKDLEDIFQKDLEDIFRKDLEDILNVKNS